MMRGKRQKQFRRRGPYALALPPNLYVPLSILVSSLAREYRNHMSIPSELRSQVDDIYFYNNQGQLLQSGPADIPLPEGFKEFYSGG
jgi:hypothetical protein